ncbi:MAG: RagB/SusD family nutrient uptake outer membrane protein, partial [Muribaculaceae bacterium]|nr:RagB/SusD family nutrient uptake outer membrane protein [Muribaculaceae bacterium]
PQDEWFQTAGLSGGADEGRERIINLCVGREPRFYAWVGFDGGDYGLRIKNGEPIHLNNIDKNQNGYNRSIRNNSITGFQSQKYIPPTARKSVTDGSWVNFQWTARAIVRLGELYLIRAEAAAALGNDTQAMSDVNVIRERAGAALLTADHLSKMSMMEWVKNERMVEFAFEGKRLTDLIRWVEADKYLAAGVRRGLNANVENPTVEEFNTPMSIPYNYVWARRMYLYPIPQNELYSNPQIVQNPGY